MGGLAQAGGGSRGGFVNGVREVARGLRRLLREATGEAKWDDYLDQCASAGTEPMARKEFERRRAHQRECSTRARCC